MKTIYFLLKSAACFCVIASLQLVHAEKVGVYFLEEKSQKSILFAVCTLSHPIPCPLELTNRLSDTNLFSEEERRELMGILLKYKNVTTNAGPLGSVLTELDQAKFGKDKEEGFLARFTYSNTLVQDEVLFLTNGERFVKFQSSPGNGFYAELLHGSLCAYERLYTAS